MDHEGKRFFVSLPAAVEMFPATIMVTDDWMVHHLRTVVRAKPKEWVMIVDAQRELVYGAVIEELQKQSVVLSIQQQFDVPKQPLPEIILAVALIKEQRWDWLLQKTTELGIRTFQPLLTERSVIRLAASDIPKKLKRWQAVVLSAAEQSEGLFIPNLLPPLSVSDYLTELPSMSFMHPPLQFILRERGENRQSLKQQLKNIQPQQPVILAIGPEGGWTQREFNTFEQAGFISVSLGTRILRSETAAIASVSALVHEFGI
jgi:16S rRNA (uracil1498-N3)-methyltransferase